MKAFWFGLGIGVGLGVLTARQEGSVTRAQLWRGIREAASDTGSDSTQEWRGAAEHGDSHASARDDEQSRGREASLDKTLADSFPTSDPPSSIPDPSSEESSAA
jgi:hypothetical protein